MRLCLFPCVDLGKHLLQAKTRGREGGREGGRKEGRKGGRERGRWRATAVEGFTSTRRREEITIKFPGGLKKASQGRVFELEDDQMGARGRGQREGRVEEGQEGGMEEAHAPLNGWGVTVGHERENELRDVKVMRGKPAVTLHGLSTRQGQGVRLMGGREGGSGGGRGGRRGGRVGISRGLTVVGVLRCGGKGRRGRRGRYGKDQCR